MAKKVKKLLMEFDASQYLRFAAKSLVVGFAALMVSCGPQLGKLSGTSEDKDSSGAGKGQEETVAISVRITEKTSSQKKASFQLADAAAYSMSLDGCASGLTGTATQANPVLNVYKFDQNCLAKLTTFQVNGSTYVPTSADPFTTWIAGDIATFEDSLDPLNKLRVVVSSQLASPIAGTETISYTFSQIAAGTDQTIAQNVVSTSRPITVSGKGAPAFKVKELSYVGMTAQGAGQFQFKLECDSSLTGTGATLACQDNLISSLRYKLVKDTYGGTLDIATAASLFPTGAISVDPGEIIAVGNSALPKGGFTTPIATDPEVLTGPNQLHLNPNMILIIEGSSTSYTYFNVDVSTITN